MIAATAYIIGLQSHDRTRWNPIKLQLFIAKILQIEGDWQQLTPIHRPDFHADRIKSGRVYCRLEAIEYNWVINNVIISYRSDYILLTSPVFIYWFRCVYLCECLVQKWHLSIHYNIIILFLQGRLVCADYGRPSDYELLSRHNVLLNGTVVIIRHNAVDISALVLIKTLFYLYEKYFIHQQINCAITDANFSFVM